MFTSLSLWGKGGEKINYKGNFTCITTSRCRSRSTCTYPIQNVTRKHYNRMRTANLSGARGQGWRSLYRGALGQEPGGGGCTVRPKLTKFEHVRGKGEERLYSDFQLEHVFYGSCMVRSNVSCVMVTWDPLPLMNRQTNRHTPLKTLLSRKFVGGR